MTWTPQTQAAGKLGNSVTVQGTLEGSTIHVSSLELLTSIGLAVGNKAPHFLFAINSARNTRWKV